MAPTRGFSLIEVVLALALLTLAATVFVDAILYTERTAFSGSLVARGRLLASECLEAVRWMRDADGWDVLADGGYGLDDGSGRWEFAPLPDVADGFTRRVEISAYDADTKQVVCDIGWDDGASRSFTVATLLAR